MFCTDDLMSYVLLYLEILCIIAILNREAFSIFNELMMRRSWPEMAAQWLEHLPLVLEVPESIQAFGKEQLGVNMLSHVSCAGITQNKCAIL